MSEGSESELIGEFREVLARGELTDKVAVDYRVSVGMPGEDVETFTVSGGIPVRLRLAGDGQLTAPDEATIQLDPSQTRQLLEQVASSLDGMVPRAQARFIPDSAVGSVTIAVHGDEATFYFLADEGQRQGQEELLARGAAEAIRPLREMAMLLQGERGTGQ
jgi:hypothetical protein